MTKVMQRKPGPKSVKQSKIFNKRGTLGETSAESSEEDDSSPEQTLDNKSQQAAITPESRIISRSHIEAANASEFRTPDTENDVTDYGLEFTTSHIQNPSPRRCSTLRTAPSSQEELQSGIHHSKAAIKENETPRSALNKTPPPSQKTKPVKKATAKQKKLKGTPKPKEPLSSAKETPADKTENTQQVARKPRKRPNPMQLEKRFWKDVQNLQNRTDHLIPMLPFSRLVRELMHDASTEVFKITPTALEALQTSSELYLTQRLQDAYMLTLHRGRVTLDVKDMELINYLKINL
ncbi:histone H3-like centromeric protein cid [Lucilia sericata]|uniref:histone H3-like centromeric protein cid n=1 Tax=Lucilia sericata TaxID=13632 RepID=UPI0018A83A6D|nr:histone H3-like centromeric protein cid [Lucilia sericata]